MSISLGRRFGQFQEGGVRAGSSVCGSWPRGYPHTPETFPPGSCLHSVVQLRHQSESQVAREVAAGGPSRRGRAVPLIDSWTPSGAPSAPGVPLGGHRPRDDSPLCRLGAPVPSRAFTPARRAGSGLADSRWAGKLRYSWGTLASMLSTLSASSKATPPFRRGG